MSRENTFHPLCDIKTSHDQLACIGGLIYDTDPYIYPAWLESREKACSIIPNMMRRHDSMINKESLFVCMEQECITGIILWHKGPLDWQPNAYFDACRELKIAPSPHLDIVKRKYFDTYNQVPRNVVSILNVCVDARRRGQDNGKKLMGAFLANPSQRDMAHELVVLANNVPAIRLYESLGFKITRSLPGFSLDETPICFEMKRDADDDWPSIDWHQRKGEKPCPTAQLTPTKDPRTTFSLATAEKTGLS